MEESQSIADVVERHLASEDTVLPVFGGVGLQVRELLASDDFDMGAVQDLIAKDAGLASEVLRYANASFFGGLEPVTTVSDAVMRLGARQICKLAMLASQRQNFKSRAKGLQVMVQALWRHAVGVATGSEWLAQRCGFGERADEAFLAGLLHDAGKLLLLRVLDDLLMAHNDFRPSRDLVLSMLDSMHVEQGQRLLKGWNLPDTYVDVVRDHHAAEFDVKNILVPIVSLADSACHKFGIGLTSDESILLPTLPAAQCIAASEIMLAELEIYLEDALELAT